MQKWRVKSDALLTTKSRDRFNGLKRDVTFYRPITANCFPIFIDKHLNMLAKWRINIFQIFF